MVMMRSGILVYFLLAGILLSACGRVTHPLNTTNTLSPPPATPSLPPTTPPGYTLEKLESLSPQDTLVQLDYEPTFSRPEAFYAYGRLPPFTLLADGMVIYLQECQTVEDQVVMQARLTPDEALALLDQVQALGFSELEDYTDTCRDMGGGTRQCVEDSSFTILRVLQPDGRLRQVKIYHNFTQVPEVLDSIRQLLVEYQHPEAQPYKPERATLFLRALESVRGVELQPWPLGSGWLRALDSVAEGEKAFLLEGKDLGRFLDAVPSNTGDFFFEYQDRYFSAYLIPWPPGVDYGQFLSSVSIPTEGVPTLPPPAATLSVCHLPAVELTQPQSGLRLAYIRDGDLWLLDEGERAHQVTTTGEVQSLGLSLDGEMVAFTRQPGDKPVELWVVQADGSGLRRLAGEPFSGSLSLPYNVFSPDRQLLAFLHQLSDHSQELWVARLDGSGAKRLVSAQDLMAIVQEPTADRASLTGLTWIPGTHDLTYDAYPLFDQDGIYIYVQRQVWKVDADSGEQSLLLPPGEGGALDYSPDGRWMTIITPDSLRLMDLNSGEIHPAGVGYAAVGMGEYYYYPPLVWHTSGDFFLLAQLDAAEFTSCFSDCPVAIWRVPADGAPAEKLAEFKGNISSFAISPDQSLVAYVRAEFPSNMRELHLARVDSSEDLIYDTAFLPDFWGWSPDSGHFFYVYGEAQENQNLGYICEPPRPFAPITYPTWLDAGRFLFVSGLEGHFEVRVGNLSGEIITLAQVEEYGDFDYVVTPENQDK